MKVPVLFIIFKRADTTQKVFKRIREAQPPQLFIAADGPRSDRQGEAELCAATRKIVENIDWPCEVHRLYQDKNLGCGVGVSSAITWFFEQVEEGIILEDDILPHLDFFRYCEEMLEKYRNDSRIKCVCGSNAFYEPISSPYSYYFSHYMMVWGWATWRRTWEEYDLSLNTIPKASFLRDVKALPIKKGSKVKAINIYNTMISDTPIDTWDYQLLFSIWHHGGLTIIPINNMCKNIGFGHAEAAHTTAQSVKIELHEVASCYPLNHPVEIAANRDLDEITFMEMYTTNYGLSYKLKRAFQIIKSFFNFS